MATTGSDAETEQANTEAASVEVVEQVDVGVRVKSKLKRGTGTRDEDKHTVEVERRTVERALEDLDAVLAAFEDEYAERVRNIDPTRTQADE